MKDWRTMAMMCAMGAAIWSSVPATACDIQANYDDETRGRCVVCSGHTECTVCAEGVKEIGCRGLACDEPYIDCVKLSDVVNGLGIRWMYRW